MGRGLRARDRHHHPGNYFRLKEYAYVMVNKDRLKIKIWRRRRRQRRRPASCMRRDIVNSKSSTFYFMIFIEYPYIYIYMCALDNKCAPGIIIERIGDKS